MQFSKYVLSNGLRLITIPQPNSLTTTSLFLVEAGSQYENKDINGISHFLEHMCFKGTERRTTPLTIASELDALGANYNAFTGREYTGYYTKSRAADTSAVLDLLSDVYLHSIFNEAEVNKERGVIIEEINMYEDSPARQVHQLYAETLYGDQPAGWDVAGTKDHIRSISRDQIVAYHNEHYLPNATAVVIAGNIDEEAVRKEIEGIFTGSTQGTKKEMASTTESQNSPQARTQYKETDQAHIVLGFRTTNIHDPKRHALTVLANILGGGMSSRLFQRVRVAMGAAYYVRAHSDLYNDHGYLAASAGIALPRVTDVIGAILEEFQRLIHEPIPEDELSRTKGNLKGSLAIDLETSDDLAHFFGTQEIVRGEVREIESIMQQIEAVTPQQIQEAAQTYFIEKGLNLAVIGPYQDAQEFLPLLHL